MKKLNIGRIVIITLLIVLGYQSYKIINTKDHIFNPMRNEVQKQSTSQKLNKKDISILTQEIRETGEIKILEAIENVPYSDKEEEKVLGLTYKVRGINADLYFIVDWFYNLNNIKISKSGDTVTIILTQNMNISVSYDSKMSNMESQESWLSKGYKAEEINSIIMALQDNVADKASVDGNMYDKAYVSLENNIRNICEGLGYKDVIVEFKGE
jgi:hypothetical protein